MSGNEIIARYSGYQILFKKYETSQMCSSNESQWVWEEGYIVCDSSGHEVVDWRQEPYFELNDLPFNSDWNLLIGVIQRIKETAGPCTANDTKEKRFAFLVFSLSITTPIETAYEYVVNYIKWFNSNKL